MTKTQVVKINSPLTIRNRALKYANRDKPKYHEREMDIPVQELPHQDLCEFLDNDSDCDCGAYARWLNHNFADRGEMGIVSKGRKGATIGNLTKAMTCHFNAGREELKDEKLTQAQKERIEGTCRLVISWLFMDETEVFGPTSRADLTPQQINGLGRWMTEYKNGEYIQRRMFPDELAWLAYWAGQAYKWTTDALSIGDEILFSDILFRYQEQTAVGDGEPGYWDLQVLSGVEKQVNEKLAAQDVPSEENKNGNEVETEPLQESPQVAAVHQANASVFDGLPE